MSDDIKFSIDHDTRTAPCFYFWECVRYRKSDRNAAKDRDAETARHFDK